MMNARHLAWQVPLACVVVGALLTAYFNIINSLGTINENIANAVGVLTARVGIVEQRQSDDHQLIEETRQDQRDFAAQLRQAIEAGIKAGRH